ncbi:hypothetical protein C8R45DRAFT_1165921 [Mycena sanguinolenta]|nr:hypothetical protein C8R45DRAFT_1165921 [Mycena sanguinolenta]
MSQIPNECAVDKNEALSQQTEAPPSIQGDGPSVAEKRTRAITAPATNDDQEGEAEDAQRSKKQISIIGKNIAALNEAGEENEAKCSNCVQLNTACFKPTSGRQRSCQTCKVRKTKCNLAAGHGRRPLPIAGLDDLVAAVKQLTDISRQILETLQLMLVPAAPAVLGEGSSSSK